MAAPKRLMKTPRSIDIEITGKCNLRCLYCAHFSTSADVENDLPKEDWFRFFEELNRCSVLDVVLSGGEPFCRKDMRDILDSVVDNRLRYTILTNGTLITDEISRYLASTTRCNMVQVSIDGPDAATHDSCRGSGNFDKAISGIKLLQKYGVPVSVRVTIHNDNVRHLEKIADLLLNDLGLPAFSTNSASSLGLCQKNSPIQLGTEGRMIAMNSLVALAEKYPERIFALAGPLAEARSWSMMERARSQGLPGMANRGYLTGCNCTMSSLSVRADGMLVPCNLLSHIELGYIDKVDLIDVWQRHPELTRLRERSKIPLSDFEFCRGCNYIPYCTGSCPALAYTLIGKVDHPSPDACYRLFLDNGGKLPENLSD